MFCANCGKEMDDNAKFCPSCGMDATGETVSKQPEAKSETPPTYSEPPVSPVPVSSGSGVAAMVCGIIALILCWVPFIGLVFGIVAMVLGGKGMRTLPQGKKGMAIAGFVMGIIGLVVGVIILIIWIIALVTFGSLATMYGVSGLL